MEPSKTYLRSRTFLRDLLVGAVVIVALTLATKYAPHVPDAAAPASAAKSIGCDAAISLVVLSKAYSLQVIRRMDAKPGQMPVFYVDEPWTLMPRDGKELLDASLQCFITEKTGRRTVMLYRDYQSGKDVAESNAGGLSLK